MKVELAKKAGFCFGVKRAIDMVVGEVRKGRPVYTLGPIIHNEEVVKDLQAKGVVVVDGLEELESVPKGTVVIRSHGVAKNVYEVIRDKGFEVVDATCPYVKKIHDIAEKESGAGKGIVIIGNQNHPEVEGIRGWTNGGAVVVETEEDAERCVIPKGVDVCVVAQTTYNYKKFKVLVEILLKRGYHINAMNTICNATEERQEEARRLAKSAEAMIVIGGRNSSNTQKLYEICKDECENTYYIQTLDDLDLGHLKSFRSVGITAGASTPNKIIEEVQKKCQK